MAKATQPWRAPGGHIRGPALPRANSPRCRTGTGQLSGGGSESVRRPACSVQRVISGVDPAVGVCLGHIVLSARLAPGCSSGGHQGNARPAPQQPRGSLSPHPSVCWSFCQSWAGPRDVFASRWVGSGSESGVFSQASKTNTFAAEALTLGPRLCPDQCREASPPTDCSPGMLPEGPEQGTGRQAQGWQLVLCPE